MAQVFDYQGARVAVPYFFAEVVEHVAALTSAERFELAKGPLDHNEGCRVCKTLGYPHDLSDGLPWANACLSAYHNCVDIEHQHNAPRYPNGLLATESLQQARCFLIYALARAHA